MKMRTLSHHGPALFVTLALTLLIATSAGNTSRATTVTSTPSASTARAEESTASNGDWDCFPCGQILFYSRVGECWGAPIGTERWCENPPNSCQIKITFNNGNPPKAYNLPCTGGGGESYGYWNQCATTGQFCVYHP